MDVESIAKLIKNMVWLVIGLIVLPIGIAALWLLILMLISINLENGTTFGFITMYLITFLGMMITTGASLWFGNVFKNVLKLTKIKDVIEKFLREQLEKLGRSKK